MFGYSNFDPPISYDYKTTEKVVGEWVDGKPVYENCVTGTFPSLSKNNSRYAANVTSDLSALNIDIFIRCYGNYDFISSGDTYTRTLGSVTIASSNPISGCTVVDYLTNTKILYIIFQSYTNSLKPTDFTVFYQYTKIG